MRVLTLNLWGRSGAWDRRRDVLVQGLRELRPDLVAFQEAIRTDDHDTAAELLAPSSPCSIRRRTSPATGCAWRSPAAGRSRHAILAGDLDAVPEAASIRFLTGLQSLGGISVCYRDEWASLHPDDPGHTFALRNPLVMEESEVRQEVGRRIDYVFVRGDANGPTLEIRDCALAFAEPVGEVWASDHFGVVADLAPG
jgi:endonuclease/exonuclease/phosphatase family metal-dependent hydrolase